MNPGIFAKCFPSIFSFGTGDTTSSTRSIAVSMSQGIHHLTKYAFIKPLQLPESALAIVQKQIKQLEARLAMEGHVLTAHLQREASESADKKEIEKEKRMLTSLILLANPD
jgi:hypothetical protein